MFTISAWMFTVPVWCGICETDLGKNNLETKLREIADHELFGDWLSAKSKFINWVSAPK